MVTINFNQGNNVGRQISIRVNGDVHPMYFMEALSSDPNISNVSLDDNILKFFYNGILDVSVDDFVGGRMANWFNSVIIPKIENVYCAVYELLFSSDLDIDVDFDDFKVAIRSDIDDFVNHYELSDFSVSFDEFLDTCKRDAYVSVKTLMMELDDMDPELAYSGVVSYINDFGQALDVLDDLEDDFFSLDFGGL